MWHTYCVRTGMKNILLSCLALFVVASVVGCSDTDKTTTTTQSAPMQTDTKDMKK